MLLLARRRASPLEALSAQSNELWEVSGTPKVLKGGKGRSASLSLRRVLPLRNSRVCGINGGGKEEEFMHFVVESALELT